MFEAGLTSYLTSLTKKHSLLQFKKLQHLFNLYQNEKHLICVKVYLQHYNKLETTYESINRMRTLKMLVYLVNEML